MESTSFDDYDTKQLIAIRKELRAIVRFWKKLVGLLTGAADIERHLADYLLEINELDIEIMNRMRDKKE